MSFETEDPAVLMSSQRLAAYFVMNARNTQHGAQREPAQFNRLVSDLIAQVDARPLASS